jgi:hypothetical protein
MSKTGEPLDRIPCFTAEITSTLRETFSATTVEEFVDLALGYPGQVRHALGASHDQWQTLVDEARRRLPDSVLHEIVAAKTRSPFSTGHDAPDQTGKSWSKGGFDDEP